ncbi:hypothetical protein [Enterovibrio norvegicus]|uniref:hypothetical protein n=1 Tax=Enterovibrio norvegicus TaxID=188144 RepID=UPI00352CB432
MKVHQYQPEPFWEETIENIQSLILNNYSISIGWSGGKDSTCVLILFLEAMRRLVVAGHSNLPKCIVLNSDTRREMPLIASYAEYSITQIEIYCAKNKLPVSVHQVQPSLSSRFMWTTIGRGKMPRFAGMSRDCSVDEKITPQQRLVKRLEKENQVEYITLLGTRFSESASRNRSMQKWSMSDVQIVEVDGRRTYAPIASYEVEDVWELIVGCSGTKERPPRIFPTYSENFDEMVELYRSANAGECAVNVADKGRSACGSRFGCSLCLVAGDRDKSLESMLDEDIEKYGFMAGFVKLRNYILAIRWDLNTRDWRGRKIEGGYMKIVPDYYSPHTKRSLLRFMLTLDALEIERARAFANKYYAKDSTIAKNEYNDLMCEPRFQNVTWDDLLAIDFAWSLGRDWSETSPAARDWLEIHELGHRYHIPEVETAERVTIPKARWFDVSAQLDNPPIGLKGLVPTWSGLEELQIDYSEELAIEPGAGWSYLNAVRDNFWQLDQVDNTEVARAALHNGWIKMRRADVERYERIALRHDYVYKIYTQEKPMKEDEYTGDIGLMSMRDFLLASSISDAEHKAIMKEQHREKIAEDYAQDLFGVESVIEAIDNQTEEKKPVAVPKEKTLTSLEVTKMAAGQQTLF